MPTETHRPQSPARGDTVAAENTVTWRVWAPKPQSIELLLYGDGAEPEAIPLQRREDGYATVTRTGIAEGTRYAYRLDDGQVRPDPASRWQPDGVNTPSAVLYPERFAWSEGNWSGVRRQDLVIYELHVGTFTAAGTFDAIIPRIDSLKELGITAIEILPVAQFPGDRNWGYDGVHPYAVQNSYGGPHGFQRLVDACHRQGMAVILDVVYNHFGPEGNYLGDFGPYFTGHYRTPWGDAVNFDDRGSDAVREFVIENVRQWIRDYHVDGLRLDAVHAIYDFGAKHILREIKEVADQEANRLGRPVQIIAESDLNDARLIDLPERGGYGLDAQWSDDFHHCVHSLLTGERRGYYADFGRPDQLAKALRQAFVYDGVHSVSRGRRHGGPPGEHSGDRFVVAIQNHDQVGNRAAGDRFGTLLDPAEQRLAAGFLLLAPQIPMLFMGEEYGETRPFPFFCSFINPDLIEAVREGRRREFEAFDWQADVPDPQAETTFESARLTWEWPDGSWHHGLRQLYRDLLDARRHWPALGDFMHRQATVAEFGNGNVVALRRGREDQHLSAFFNLSEQEIPLADTAGLELLFSSESSRYGGTRTGEDGKHVLLPHEFQVYGPGEWRRA